MKTKITVLAFLFLSGIVLLNSCNKEEEIAKPQITLTELGLDNSKIGYIGSDLHVEADLIAEGKIKNVSIIIHPEDSATWEFDSVYTKFSGLKNATFHEHIEIPESADAGHYHFHLVVTDNEGNQTTAESELELQFMTDKK